MSTSSSPNMLKQPLLGNMNAQESKHGRAKALFLIIFFMVFLIIFSYYIFVNMSTYPPPRIGYLLPRYGTETSLARLYHDRIKGFLSRDGVKCESIFFVKRIHPPDVFEDRWSSALTILFHAHPQACLVILSRPMMEIDDGRSFSDKLKPLSDSNSRILEIPLATKFLLDDTPALWVYTDLWHKEYFPEVILDERTWGKLIWSKYDGVYLGSNFDWMDYNRRLYSSYTQ